MDDVLGRAPSRDARGRFGPGNPGRPPGSRNRLPRRIALSLLRNFEENEEKIFSKLNGWDDFNAYMRLLGSLLPRDLDEELRSRDLLAPRDAARVARGLRHALDTIDEGRDSIADILSALADHGLELGSALNHVEFAAGARENPTETEPRKVALELVPAVGYGESADAVTTPEPEAPRAVRSQR